MSKRVTSECFADIKEACARIKGYIASLSYNKFLRDTKTQDAVVRNLEIIGEAVKNIPSGVRLKYPQIPWKKIAGLRDRLIHHYFGVNLDIVWTIVSDELPLLEKHIIKIINKH
ncbi:MAG: DUF86 domain-containing protein [Candidatus Omnitrophica bacterium]|nr:DUF86 domain-containing protein [Candidatus Omnitrophota bacterium]